MKGIFFLITSLMLALALCLVLVVTGIVKYEGGGKKAEVAITAKKMVHRVTKALNDLPNSHFQGFSLFEGKGSTAYNASGQSPSRPTEQRPVPAGEKRMDGTHEALLYERSMSFLKSIEDKGEANIEDRFTDFLRQDLGLDNQEVAKFIRMSFWKNFVTLQHPWRPEEKQVMETQFAREKELKKAGFAAKGLTLMRGHIEEAENKLREIGRRLSSSAAGENKL